MVLGPLHLLYFKTKGTVFIQTNNNCLFKYNFVETGAPTCVKLLDKSNCHVHDRGAGWPNSQHAEGQSMLLFV